MDKKSHKKLHWDNVFATKDTTKVSWYQVGETTSQQLIQHYAGTDDAIIDIGCGDSMLLDNLISTGYTHLTGLDISGYALERIKNRLGSKVALIESDITTFQPNKTYQLWHDRAVFHFLTDAFDIQNYAHTLSKSLGATGIAIIATFANDKIRTCSNLPTKGYDAKEITHIFGDYFQIIEAFTQEHLTPNTDSQLFHYAVLQHNKNS